MTGILNFLNKAIVQGWAFTRGMYQKLKIKDKNGNPLKTCHHVTLSKQFKEDCRIWKIFLTNTGSQQLCRSFTDFRAPEEGAEVLSFYSDASLSEKLRMGAVFNNNYLVQKWDSAFICEKKPSIEFLELCALVAAVLTWGRKFRLENTKLVIFCVNMSVLFMVNKFTSNCLRCLKLIRILTLENIWYNRRIFVRHVWTEQNILADSLSCLNFPRFWRNAPLLMNQVADQIPSEIWPLEKVSD